MSSHSVGCLSWGLWGPRCPGPAWLHGTMDTPGDVWMVWSQGLWWDQWGWVVEWVLEGTEFSEWCQSDWPKDLSIACWLMGSVLEQWSSTNVRDCAQPPCWCWNESGRGKGCALGLRVCRLSLLRWENSDLPILWLVWVVPVPMVSAGFMEKGMKYGEW